jgi:prepilin-type N-terminal cleavage/methylation domain-containing protein
VDVLEALYRRLRAASHSDEGGFSLIEVIVALTLLLFIMSASVVFFVRSLQVSGLQQQRQAATALGEQQLELARNVTPTGLVCGRTKANVDAAWAVGQASTSPELQAELAATATAEDWALPTPARHACTLTLPTGTTEAVPSAQTAVTIGNTSFKYQVYIGDCWLVGTTCGNGSAPYTGANANKYVYRIIVAVSWTPKAGQSCSTGLTCYFVDESLRDWHPDPVYVKAG